jgi:hypothetical protein
MEITKVKPSLLCLFGCLCAMLQACGSIHSGLFPETPEPSSRQEARAILSALETTNKTLLSFKGIGRIELTRDGNDLFSTRSAWAGLYPDRFRIEILAMSGQPLLSLAYDQDLFCYFSHTDATYYQDEISGATLEKIASIPVPIEDAMKYLTGRIPVCEHETSYLQQLDPEQGFLLVLEAGWTGVAEKIYLDEKKTKIYKVEMFGITGALQYRAELTGELLIDGYRLPAFLTLSNGSGDTVSLRIDRYVVNAPVSESMFTIPPPE